MNIFAINVKYLCLRALTRYLALKFKEMEEAREKENEQKEKEATVETTTIEAQHEEHINPVSDKIKQEEHISDTTDNSVDGASEVHSIKADEIPQHVLSAHAAQPVQQLEADVEIHNFGSSGHLSPLSNQNSDP